MIPQINDTDFQLYLHIDT